MSVSPDDSAPAEVDRPEPASATPAAAPVPAPRPPLPSQFARLPRPPRPVARAVVDPESVAVAPPRAAVDQLVADANDPVATESSPGEHAGDAHAPVDAAPVDAAPVDAAPVDAAPVDPAAADMSSADPRSADAAPADTAPDPSVLGQASDREMADLASPRAGDSGDKPADDAEAAAGGGDPAKAGAELAADGTDQWGRVAEDGTVFVRTSDGERAVGSWQVGEPVQALAYYRRKYDALVVEVELLERRVRSGALPADEATTAMRRTRENVDAAQAVGDLASLVARLDRLQALIDARRARRKAERAKAVEASRRTKEELVTEAETLGESSDWHDGADRLRAMLDQWKALPRLDKATDDGLWHRFSAARTTYTRRRKAHFAVQADKRDDAKATKERLVAEAEDLSTSTEWGPTAARYRALMTEWKAAGPAPRKDEETLWKRFRGAQDVFFAARSATLSERDNDEKEALQVKEQLLVEAEALLPVTDLAAAKSALRSIQDRWSAAGRVPRDAMTRIEARLRKVEETVRAGEQAEWTRTSPEALARAEATVAQLRASVQKLEKQAAGAEQAGDARKLADARAAIDTRQSWLAEAEKTLAEFRR